MLIDTHRCDNLEEFCNHCITKTKVSSWYLRNHKKLWNIFICMKTGKLKKCIKKNTTFFYSGVYRFHFTQWFSDIMRCISFLRSGFLMLKRLMNIVLSHNLWMSIDSHSHTYARVRECMLDYISLHRKCLHCHRKLKLRLN